MINIQAYTKDGMDEVIVYDMSEEIERACMLPKPTNILDYIPHMRSRHETKSEPIMAFITILINTCWLQLNVR